MLFALTPNAIMFQMLNTNYHLCVSLYNFSRARIEHRVYVIVCVECVRVCICRVLSRRTAPVRGCVCVSGRNAYAFVGINVSMCLPLVYG